jgi:hypothetical protein
MHARISSQCYRAQDVHCIGARTNQNVH